MKSFSATWCSWFLLTKIETMEAHGRSSANYLRNLALFHDLPGSTRETLDSIAKYIETLQRELVLSHNRDTLDGIEHLDYFRHFGLSGVEGQDEEVARQLSNSQLPLPPTRGKSNANHGSEVPSDESWRKTSIRTDGGGEQSVVREI